MNNCNTCTTSSNNDNNSHKSRRSSYIVDDNVVVDDDDENATQRTGTNSSSYVDTTKKQVIPPTTTTNVEQPLLYQQREQQQESSSSLIVVPESVTTRTRTNTSNTITTKESLYYFQYIRTLWNQSPRTPIQPIRLLVVEEEQQQQPIMNNNNNNRNNSNRIQINTNTNISTNTNTYTNRIIQQQEEEDEQQVVSKQPQQQQNNNDVTTTAITTTTTTTATTTASSYRDRLVQFYQQYNPNKINTIDSTLEKYKGKEEIMFQKLLHKYTSLSTTTTSTTTTNDTILYPTTNTNIKPYRPIVFIELEYSNNNNNNNSNNNNCIPNIATTTTTSRSRSIIQIQLYHDISPYTCENFRCLCTGEKRNNNTDVSSSSTNLCYINTYIHRIVPNMCIQGGDITIGDGTGGRSIYPPNNHQYDPKTDLWGNFIDEQFILQHCDTGLVSMANNGPNRNNSQFFITLRPTNHLNNKHVVFGKVISGLETIIHTIATVPIDSKTQRPLSNIRIIDCGEIRNSNDDNDDTKVWFRASDYDNNDNNSNHHHHNNTNNEHTNTNTNQQSSTTFSDTRNNNSGRNNNNSNNNNSTNNVSQPSNNTTNNANMTENSNYSDNNNNNTSNSSSMTALAVSTNGTVNIDLDTKEDKDNDDYYDGDNCIVPPTIRRAVHDNSRYDGKYDKDVTGKLNSTIDDVGINSETGTSNIAPISLEKRNKMQSSLSCSQLKIMMDDMFHTPKPPSKLHPISTERQVVKVVPDDGQKSIEPNTIEGQHDSSNCNPDNDSIAILEKFDIHAISDDNDDGENDEDKSVNYPIQLFPPLRLKDSLVQSVQVKEREKYNNHDAIEVSKDLKKTNCLSSNQTPENNVKRSRAKSSTLDVINTSTTTATTMCSNNSIISVSPCNSCSTTATGTDESHTSDNFGAAKTKTDKNHEMIDTNIICHTFYYDASSSLSHLDQRLVYLHHLVDDAIEKLRVTRTKMEYRIKQLQREKTTSYYRTSHSCEQ